MRWNIEISFIGNRPTTTMVIFISKFNSRIYYFINQPDYEQSMELTILKANCYVLKIYYLTTTICHMVRKLG